MLIPKANVPKSLREASFTIIETVIALGLLTVFILEIGGVQGNAVYFNEYGRNVTQATWLAKRIMSQVEYHWEGREFKELETEVKGQRFEDAPEFSYDITIKEWKLPLWQLLSGGGGEDEEDKSSESSSQTDMMQQGLSQVLGDELLKVANVEVFWTEGAKQNSTQLTLLLTNQRKVDEVIGGLQGVAKSLLPTPTPGPSAPGPASGAAPPNPASPPRPVTPVGDE